MSTNATELSLLGLTLFFQLLIVTLVPAIVALDVIYFGTRVGETSVTEHVQESLLFLAACIYGWAAMKRPDYRGALVLLTGLLACMLIREQDSVFDRISHGAWVYPAWLCAFATLYIAYKNRDTIISAIVRFRAQSFFAYLSIGLLVVLGFSRIFGTGALWDMVVPGFADGRIKTAVQEGLELFGYALVFYSAIVFSAQRIFFEAKD